MPEAKPKSVRVLNPAIAALRAEHKARVEEFKMKEASAAVLKRIVEDLLPKMTAVDLGLLSKNVAEQISKKPF